MEGEVRIELTTYWLTANCSTTELHSHIKVRLIIKYHIYTKPRHYQLVCFTAPRPYLLFLYTLKDSANNPSYLIPIFPVAICCHTMNQTTEIKRRLCIRQHTISSYIGCDSIRSNQKVEISKLLLFTIINTIILPKPYHAFPV